ncbi:PH domain-containing protein [Corynebacterium macclintockiae]|uniref:PH domain-containing protein n=1 Tax=Corynebacterium macclintockiae TaxID=2913501 RepID=UPI003EB92AA8
MSDKDEWELEVSSPFLKKLAWILVVLVMAVHIFMAIVVAVGDTGVTVTSADRWGFIGIGLVFSFVALSLLRPHVKVNSQGVEVRNIVNGQFYPWEIIHGLSFPQEAKWARLELPDFEFVPMMALNIYDKQLIAQRVEDFRQLEDRYMPFDE